MSARNTLHELLLHQATTASEITNAASLAERTERSLCIAKSFCHGSGSHPVEVKWPFVDFVLGGKVDRNNESVLTNEHKAVIHEVETLRSQMSMNIGALVSKVELQISSHHYIPVLRPIWAGKLARPAPRYELRRRSESEFAVTLKALVSGAHTGSGPREQRYLGDSGNPVPVPVLENRLSVAAYGFVLSTHGVGPSDENFPMLVYGKEKIHSVVERSMVNPASVVQLQACLDYVDSQHL